MDRKGCGESARGDWATKAALVTLVVFSFMLPRTLWGQTDCDAGNGTLDPAEPKTISSQQVIQKLGVAEAAAKNARRGYSYKQDVLMQTLTGTSVTGVFHEVTTVSYDAKGNRKEEVTFAAQSTLRGLQLTKDDMEDIRVFMPLMLTSDDLKEYNLSYSGQQHVDDLDTYRFEVAPKKVEKDRRYFQGKIWVDAQDFQIVKVCGKSGPDKIAKKKRERSELHATFVTYRQQVDGQWFPAYTRSDDTLQFPGGSTHLKQIVKFSNYKLAATR